jgi:hypothetical protein
VRQGTPVKPSYEALKRHHNSGQFYKPGYVSDEAVYQELGFELAELLKLNASYKNTCATRMSVALLKAGVSVQGRLKIRSGNLAGKSVEPGAKLLADQLARPGVFGAPTIFQRPAGTPAALKGQKGVIFFWKLASSGIGHIDLVETANSTQVCNSSCFFACQEIWFWPLH